MAGILKPQIESSLMVAIEIPDLPGVLDVRSLFIINRTPAKG